MPQFNVLPHHKGDRWSSFDEEHKTIATHPDFIYVSTMLPRNSFVCIEVRKGSADESGYYNLRKVIEIADGVDN